jgi:hypothetical protein
MNNSKSVDHPWRTRTREFAQHLNQIPREERARIKAAERDFLAQRDQPYSIHQRATRDFYAIMVGAQDTVDEE